MPQNPRPLTRLVERLTEASKLFAAAFPCPLPGMQAMFAAELDQIKEAAIAYDHWEEAGEAMRRNGPTPYVNRVIRTNQHDLEQREAHVA